MGVVSEQKLSVDKLTATTVVMGPVWYSRSGEWELHASDRNKTKGNPAPVYNHA